MILVKEAAPDPASLGVTNGITQFAMVRPPSLACRRYPRTLTLPPTPQCLARSFSPAFASSLLAFSIGYEHVLLRYLWVLVMTTICFLGTTLSRRIAEGRRTPSHP